MPLLSSKGEPLRNPYELLKLERGATDDEISKSFKKLMLHLHPDKRPPGLSIEEAENVERAMYDVMEARSFLLDTEHMAARRQYDGKLLLAEQRRQRLQHLPPRNKKDLNIGTSKQSSPPPPHQQETKIDPVPAAATPGTSTKVAGGEGKTTRAKSTSKSRLESPADNNNNNSYDNNKAATARGTKSALYGLGGKMNETAVSTTPATELSVEKLEKLLAAKKAERSSSTLLNKNLNKKHWGKVKTRCRAANVKKKVDDGNKKKDNSRRMGKASFSSSCSDCSTTEDNTTSDDDLKQSYHTYLNGRNSDTAISSSKKSAADVDATTNKPSSSTTAKSSVPQPSNNNSSGSNNSSNKGKKKSFLRDSLPQLPVRQKSFHDPRPQPPGRQKSFHDSRPQLLQPQTPIEKCERSKSFSSTIPHPLHPTVKGKCYQQIFECVTPQQELVKPPTTYNPRPTLNDAIPVPQQRPFPSTIGYTSTSSRPTTTTNTTTTTLLLEKQYYCPLTKNIMKEPMSDNEGNTYERQAILTYLEIHNNKSPITGNALFPMQLIPNTSLAEQIRLALITCLDTLRE